MFQSNNFNALTRKDDQKPPLVFPGITIPDPSEADLKWQVKFDQAAAKQKDYKCAELLKRAANACSYWRVAYALNVRHQAADPDSVFSLNSNTSEYSDDMGPHFGPELAGRLWEGGDNTTKEMMVRGLYPPKIPNIFIDTKPIRHFHTDTLVNWLPHVESEELKQEILLPVITKGTADDIISAVKSGVAIDFKESAPLKTAILRKDPEIVKLMIDLGANIFNDYEDCIDLAHKQGCLDIVNVLQDCRRAREIDAGLTPSAPRFPTETAPGWVVVNKNFAELVRPRSPDGSQLKYQFDFETGMATFIYEKNGVTAAPTAQSFAQLENPALLHKAIDEIQKSGHQPPDLSPHLNPPAKRQPVKPIRRPQPPPSTK